MGSSFPETFSPQPQRIVYAEIFLAYFGLCSSCANERVKCKQKSHTGLCICARCWREIVVAREEYQRGQFPWARQRHQTKTCTFANTRSSLCDMGVLLYRLRSSDGGGGSPCIWATGWSESISFSRQVARHTQSALLKGPASACCLPRSIVCNFYLQGRNYDLGRSSARFARTGADPEDAFAQRDVCEISPLGEYEQNLACLMKLKMFYKLRAKALVVTKMLVAALNCTLYVGAIRAYVWPMNKKTF